MSVCESGHCKEGGTQSAENVPLNCGGPVHLFPRLCADDQVELEMLCRGRRYMERASLRVWAQHMGFHPTKRVFYSWETPSAFFCKIKDPKVSFQFHNSMLLNVPFIP